MSAVSVAFPGQAMLGESPVWSRFGDGLLWVDTMAASLNRYCPATGENVRQPMPGPLGFVTENQAGELIIGIGCDVATVDKSGVVRRVATAPHARDGYRLNDTRLDPAGRLWVGLMDEQLSEGSGYLYCLEPDLRWRVMDSGFTLINGLQWSRDGRTLYVTDSRRGLIHAYAYDPDSGSVRDRREWLHIDANLGKPDGLTIDREGFLLSVLFDGAAIARICPRGGLERLISLPVPRPTSCAFDADQRWLFITSARLGLSGAALEAYPASGALLQLDYERSLWESTERNR
ncbi:SMP-30/gluconolactonase/LRE family protein [Alloalcanivorax xenomutans]|uniref:SMP-30/gluconolactonase/LRE family protein n=1 Tax=Alloalcanivorax xenomutans TaxID=1094342 RepID=A0A9Q3W3V7_9GAMM|nr:SMP-30/gluconolactonase/LRE family protein [Alloalcanivorax xenomutans]MCE7508101.1 SMP-30/gluconolactonase/LRE family protein [Alloalcanivorax xenomutans]